MGEDRAACLAEAMAALVEVFAKVHDDAPAQRVMPLAAPASGDVDVLVALLEEVIYVAEVFGAVPVRFHLAEAEDGGVAGDMVVVDAGDVELIGPVPKAVSYHHLDMGEHDGCPNPSGRQGDLGGGADPIRFRAIPGARPVLP